MLVVLIIGILLGNMGIDVAIIIVTPLVLIWLMLWDEKSYRRSQQRHQKLSYKK